MLPALNFGGHLLNNCLVLFQTAVETLVSYSPLCNHHRTMLVHSLASVSMSNATSVHCRLKQCVTFYSCLVLFLLLNLFMV